MLIIDAEEVRAFKHMALHEVLEVIERVGPMPRI